MSVPAATIASDGQDFVACIVCSTPNVGAARFCEVCGTRLLFFCWSCGTPAPIGRHFCQQCGTALADPHETHQCVAEAGPLPVGASAAAPALAAPAGRTSVPAAPATSPPVAEAPMPDAALGDEDAEAQPVEERRVVSVLFADIVGFTTLSERLDPEDVRELSAAVLARLAEAVALYGGTIDKFMGDAVMALFGAPVAHEDDPLRAVRAALAMHQAVAALSQLDRDGNALELRLRIGINSGQVIAGVRDVGGHREYSVFGDVVNTAARLQTAAEPGGILLGEETARQAGGVFDVAAIEPLMLKGKAQPVPAYQVRGGVTQELSGHGLVPANGKRPLVGRLTELREVRHQLQELSNGRGRLTVIIGEHGVGKSRLLAEAREHGEELGVRWIEAMAPSYAQGLSYRLIREILSQLLDLRAGASEARLVEELAERLNKLGLGELAAPFGLVMGAESDMELTASLTAQQIQRKVLDATRRLLSVQLADRPMILVLDALQWADPSSIDLLVELMDLTDEAPILFTFVFTPDPDAPS
jgi:class 3 adenylate cyclase